MSFTRPKDLPDHIPCVTLAQFLANPTLNRVALCKEDTKAIQKGEKSVPQDQMARLALEGAGTIYLYNGFVGLCNRFEKPNLEYGGGKVEETDNDDQAICAMRENLEELGFSILISRFYQAPVIYSVGSSGRRIALHIVQLSDDELLALQECDRRLDSRPNEKKFKPVTGVYFVSLKVFLNYIKNCGPDAKAYMEDENTTPLTAKRISDEKQQVTHQLRWFNTILLKEAMETGLF